MSEKRKEKVNYKFDQKVSFSNDDLNDNGSSADLWIRVVVRQVFDISSNTGHVHLHVVFLTSHCETEKIKEKRRINLHGKCVRFLECAIDGNIWIFRIKSQFGSGVHQELYHRNDCTTFI